MRRALVLLLVAGLAGNWETARGRRFDAHATTSVRAAKVLRWAEETGRSFEDLLGGFPGKRAAIVVAGSIVTDVLKPEVVGEAPAPGPDEEWRLRFYADVSGDVQGCIVPRVPDEETRLRHVLGHRLIEEWTSRLPGGGPKADGSGCGFPDWFEEGIAGSLEPAARRADYLKAFGDLARKGGGWGLADLLSLSRPKGERSQPVAGGKKGSTDLTALLNDDQKKRLEEVRKKNLPMAADDHAEGLPFDVESWCFFEFLRREYGDAFLRHVAATLGANKGFGNVYPWLVEHRAELRDPKAVPPGTETELEKAFLDWAKKQ